MDKERFINTIKRQLIAFRFGDIIYLYRTPDGNAVISQFDSYGDLELLGSVSVIDRLWALWEA